MTSRFLVSMPGIGFGTWTLRDEACVAAVHRALDVGYRHIDTAEAYENEAAVGRAIAEHDLPREDIWITTKVGPSHFAPGKVRPTAEASLERLGVDQVDLLLLHWPSRGDEYELSDYVAQIAEVQDLGLTRHIGVSNFTKRHIDQTLAVLGDRPILTNQCEIHVFLQNRPVVDHCQSKGITMTAYCPLARGAVSDHPVLNSIAAAHGVTSAQIALAFLLHEGHMIIPSSGNPERIAQNFAAGEIRLTDDEATRLRALDEGRRLVSIDPTLIWDV